VEHRNRVVYTAVNWTAMAQDQIDRRAILLSVFKHQILASVVRWLVRFLVRN